MLTRSLSSFLRPSAALVLAIFGASAGALGACASPADATAESEAEQVVQPYRNLPVGVTTDVGSLREVIEREKTQGACERHFARLDARTEKFRAGAGQEAGARRDLVLCGKHLFFNLPFPSDTAVPENLLRALFDVFPDVTGPAMTKLGFRENPDEPGMPLEFPLIPSTKTGPVQLLTGKVRTMTCVACHMGQLPDGKFSVGMPNEKLDLATFSKLTQYPLWLTGTESERRDEKVWTKESQGYFTALRDKSKGVFHTSRIMLDLADTMGFLGAGGAVRDAAGQDPVPLSDQRSFFLAKPGQLNPSSPMLSEPHVDVYESSPGIWDMAHHEGEPMGEPYLGRITSARSLEEFVRQAYVYTTLRTDFSTPKWVDPLAAYVRTLRTPKAPTADSAADRAAGTSLFARDCASCHNGYRGATLEVQPLDAAGTPLAFDRLFENYTPPTRQSKQALEGLQKVGMLPLHRKGIKSRRFDGLWVRSKLGYNGAIEGLDHLLCLNGQTRKTLDRSIPTADSTHAELCTNYTPQERQHLKAYLRQF